jgi:Ger(x)C family germination protein
VDKSPYFASKVELGQIAKAFRGKHSFALPMVIVEKKEVKLAKAAMFNKDAKMVGVLDELEVIGGKFLRNNLKEGVIVVPNPANPAKLVVFELYEPVINIDSQLEGDKLRFSVNAKLFGTLGENMESQQDAYDRKFVLAVEKAVEAEYTRLVRNSYVRMQELRTESSDLGSLVHRQHPQYWKQIKDRWDDEVFPGVPLDVNIKVVIRRPVIMR